MSTTAAAAAPPLPAADGYESDDGLVSSNSPRLEPIRPKLEPSPSPAPSLPSSSSSSSPAASPASPGKKKKSKRWRGPKPSQADSILLGTLDNFRHEASAYTVSWASETDDAEDSEGAEDAEDARKRDLRALAEKVLNVSAVPRPGPDQGATLPTTENDVVGEKTYPATAPGMAAYAERATSQQHERNGPHPIPTPRSPAMSSPRNSGVAPLLSSKMDLRSSTASIHPSSHSEDLPPIQLNSPRGDDNGQPLPSIKHHFRDLPLLAGSHAAGNGMGTPHHGFPGSPPAAMQPRLPPMQPQHSSPPTRLGDPYLDPHSSGHHQPAPPASGSYYYSQANGLQLSRDYANPSSETAGSHQTGGPATTSGHGRMSVDNMAVQTVGTYVCKVPGCTAPPFQTQYLLNSHANVHSSARPHYCPVPGCPRGQGGKGFKRKNEMIRHGLVHNSPGYICPFCPDRDHKYPRPDNLQR
ncbi:hypothetical protein VTH06DRAFT_3608 [Thermothelomyces fergusii]